MPGSAPSRLACVDLAALPLQLLLQREPGWARHPAVVVDRDEPQGRILWVNERARRLRVLPGRRYAEGLSLAPDLHAGVVEAAEIEAAMLSIVARLTAFSPEVEPIAGEPGTFVVDAAGLEGVFPDLPQWAHAIAAALRFDGFVASVVVGFTRFGVQALARAGAGVLVLQTAAEERARSDTVRLDRLAFPPKLREALHRLGIDTVAGLRRLPPGGLLERFGTDAHRLHEQALGTRIELLAPRHDPPPVTFRHERDPEAPRLDAQSLVFLVGQGLEPVCSELARRGEALAALRIRVLLEDGAPMDTRVEPAEPTLDQAQLIGLVQLRLAALAVPSEPSGIELRADGVRASRQQLSLFTEAQKRDAKAADRALARVRAALGDDAVVRALPRAGHLPEARFRFERLVNLPVARPDATARPRLVRRILARPTVLADQGAGPDGWMPAGMAAGPVIAIHGPYVVSGGWWAGERHREYHFAELRRGEVLWLFYERARRRWFAQGTVE